MEPINAPTDLKAANAPTDLEAETDSASEERAEKIRRLEADEEEKEDAEQDADFDEGAGDPRVSKSAS